MKGCAPKIKDELILSDERNLETNSVYFENYFQNYRFSSTTPSRINQRKNSQNKDNLLNIEKRRIFDQRRNKAFEKERLKRIENRREINLKKSFSKLKKEHRIKSKMAKLLNLSQKEKLNEKRNTQNKRFSIYELDYFTVNGCYKVNSNRFGNLFFLFYCLIFVLYEN